MVLTGNEIKKNVSKGNIIITPYDEKNINPNSYDISIGTTISYYEDNVVLDVNEEPKIITATITDEGFKLKRNKYYFAESHEKIIVKDLVPILHTKSGVARKGMFSHITADLLQVTHDGTVLLQIFPTMDIIIYPHQRIAQLSFWKVWDN